MRTLRKWQEALRRETFGDDHVSVNLEIWSSRGGVTCECVSPRVRAEENVNRAWEHC